MQLKDDEVKFWRYITRQVDYNKVSYDNEYITMTLQKPVDDYIKFYSEKYNISKDLLKYYLHKWSTKGLVDYDRSEKMYLYVSIYILDFPNQNLIAYYNKVPRRVYKKAFIKLGLYTPIKH